MIVESSIIHNKEKGLKKTILLPYTNPSKIVEILIMNPQLKLSKIAIENYDIKMKLRKMGLPIISFKQNSSPKSNHVDTVFEKRVRKLVKKIICDLKGKVFSEVELVRESRILENKSTTKYYADELGLIHFNEIDTEFLLLFEIKSSFQKRYKSYKIDSAISKIINFSKSLNSSNIVPVMIFNEDLIYNNVIITDEYGSNLNMILIGQSKLQYFLKNPEALSHKIKSFCLKEKKSSRKEDKHFLSCPPTNEVLLKHKGVLSKVITNKAKVIGFRQFSGKGKIFEECIANRYEVAGYDIVSNLLLHLNKRKMEIDILAMRDKEVILISCKNMNSVLNLDYLTIRIGEAANLTQHRTDLLGFEKANVHIKTNSKVYDIVKRKFNGYWSPKIEIFIEK